LAVTDWRLRRWRLWFLALMTATRKFSPGTSLIGNFLNNVQNKFLSFKNKCTMQLHSLFDLESSRKYLDDFIEK